MFSGMVNLILVVSILKQNLLLRKYSLHQKIHLCQTAYLSTATEQEKIKSLLLNQLRSYARFITQSDIRFRRLILLPSVQAPPSEMTPNHLNLH